MMNKYSREIFFGISFLAVSCTIQSTFANSAFSSESPWMFGDWNGQRTELQQKGYAFSLGYTGEMATLLDARHASSHGTEYAD